jgi:hypothetical protein
LHYTLLLLRYTKAANIKVLAYPPHCTHALQGLDVVCFACFKDVWKWDVAAYEVLHNKPIKTDVFTELFGRAYLEVFTPELVKKAFEVTGIHPFNPVVICPEQMWPSETTSVKGLFPVSLPSPVCRVVHALRTYKPTAVELSPLTHVHATHSPHTSTIPASPSEDTPTASPKRVLAGIDPSVETPSKRARILYSSLTQSLASFLVHAAPIKSAHHLFAPILEVPAIIPAPNFGNHVECMTMDELATKNAALRTRDLILREHVVAWDAIIKRAHAQLMLQDLYGTKQCASLYTKETKSKMDRIKLKVFKDSKGRHLTADEFIAVFAAQEVLKAAEDAVRA